MKGQATVTAIRGDSLELPLVRVIAASPLGGEVAAPVGVEPLVMGTSSECDLVVRDPAVSRRHCDITLTDRGIVLRDLGSKNGTFVGDLRIVEAILPAGAVVRIGTTRLTISVASPPAVVPLSRSSSFGAALGGSPMMRALFAKLERAAASHETVLLLGEPGTGKELLARGIHEVSPRREGPLVVLDCSGMAPNLLEDELFGRAENERNGAFERADGGTVFIDEIGELPLELQPKLLRALESRQVRRLGAAEPRPFDARVVAATHRDLKARVADGAFRADLYYRLAVVELRVPPLRDRKEDIPLLVERFLAAQVPPRLLADLPPNTLQLLTGHAWPGNVRELRNVVARLVMFPDEVITAVTAEAIAGAAQMEGHGPPSTDRLLGLPLRAARDLVVEEFERKYLAGKLREAKGNVTHAAVKMGVSRQFLYRLLERYGMEREER
jgi:DNA-binding NtrC family response regulator